MLSFVFVLSNCNQLFAQEAVNMQQAYRAEAGVAIEPAVEQAVIEDMQMQLEELRRNFGYMKNYIYRLFGDVKHAENREYIEQGFRNFIEKFQKPYEDFIVGINSYDAYLNNELGKILKNPARGPMERLAQKYTNRGSSVEHFAKGYALEEGSVFLKMRENIEYVLSRWKTSGVNYRTDVQVYENQVNAALNHIETRLDMAQNKIVNVWEHNGQLYNRLAEFVEQSGTTTDDVVRYILKNIPEEDLKFLGLVKETEVRNVSKLRMAKGYRDYLRAIGSRSREARSGLIRLMRTINPDRLHARAYKEGYETLLSNFPILPQMEYRRISRLGRKAIKEGPLLIIGAVLVAGLIVEVNSNNSFFADSLGPRAMRNIADKIDSNSDDLSQSEYLAFYNSGWSDRRIETNIKDFSNLINLTIAAGRAEEDFDVIDNLFVEEERNLSLASLDINEDVQNELDERLSNITNIVSEHENMI